MANCSDALDTCLADLNNVTTEYSNCTCVPDPWAGGRSPFPLDREGGGNYATG